MDGMGAKCRIWVGLYDTEICVHVRAAFTWV